MKQEDHHLTPSQGRGKGVRHTQGGWDSDLTKIMLPRVSNDRPGQRVMQTNSCENLRMCRQTLFRPDICDIYHNRHCRSQIVIIVHSDLILFVVFFLQQFEILA